MTEPQKARLSPKRSNVAKSEFVEDARRVSEEVGIGVDELAAIYVLDSVKYLGPQAFKELRTAGLQPLDACKNPSVIPTKGLRGDKIREQLGLQIKQQWEVCHQRAIRQIITAHRHQAKIVTYTHPAYPPNVYESNYPAPVLYIRGSKEVLGTRNAVACVGTRKIGEPYSEWERAFVQAASLKGFSIISGFALGADSIGHQTAWKTNGETVCVMPGGLDRPFPPENRDLWNSLLQYQSATFVSEFPFGTSASTLTLRKRNKLIVAFAKGVLVAQSSAKGGAMNAYRFAVEQRKPVATFEPDGTDKTSGNSAITEYANGFVLKSELEAFEQWLRELSSST